MYAVYTLFFVDILLPRLVPPVPTEEQNLGMFPGASDERCEQNNSLGPVEMVKLSHNICITVVPHKAVAEVSE